MDESSILMILKLAFMALFVAIVTIVGTIPLRVKHFKKNRLLRSLGTTFAGALFVNVSLVHILPESSDAIEAYLQQQTGNQDVFPLANLLVMVGFLITIFFTRIIANHSHGHGSDSFSSATSSFGPTDFQEVPAPEKKVVPLNLNQTLLQNQAHPEAQPLHEEEQEEPEVEEEPTEKPQNHQDTYFLTLAMYFHTIFQGIAIGVQNSIGGFLSTAVAIAFHKWADALSMGIQYRHRGIKKKIAMGLIIGQAALNAAAIAFGWAIDSFGDFVQAIFLSISAGTFLAISTMEMLGQQLHRPSYRAQKFLILLFATGLICAVWFFENAVFSN